MKICVKSVHENFVKEVSDRKRNTVRELDGKDTVEITDTETGEVAVKKITDITEYKGKIIISW